MIADHSVPLFVVQVQTDRLRYALKYLIQQLLQGNVACRMSGKLGRRASSIHPDRILPQVNRTAPLGLLFLSRLAFKIRYKMPFNTWCFYCRLFSDTISTAETISNIKWETLFTIGKTDVAARKKKAKFHRVFLFVADYRKEILPSAKLYFLNWPTHSSYNIFALDSLGERNKALFILSTCICT